MKLELIDTQAPEGWDTELAAAGGTVFHSAAWARYVSRERPGVVPLFGRLTEAGRPVGCVLAFESAGRGLLKRILARRVWTDGLPVVMQSALGATLAALEGAARRRAAIDVLVGSYAANGPSAEFLGARGYALRRRLEFLLRLEAPEKELWRAMSHGRRSSVTTARRAGVRIETLSADEGVPALRRLQDATSERIAQRGGHLHRYEGSPERDPVHGLVADGPGVLIGARLNGELVSVGLFTVFNGLAYLNLSGQDRSGLQAGAPSLLIWETICRWQTEGITRLNLGGCGLDATRPDSPEHGLFAYKKAYGGETVECASGRMVLAPIRAWLATRQRR